MSFDKFLTKVFGSSNQRFLKSIQPMVEKINLLEPSIKALSDDELRARTTDFKERVQREVADITDKDERKRRERAVLDEILPAYLNALTGRGGVHVITVNDYLASRDAEWMGQIHRFLGLEVGCIQ